MPSFRVLQAYKALTTWKELKDDSLGLTQLADALRINKKSDLADYVYDVLDCKCHSQLTVIVMKYSVSKYNTFYYISEVTQL